MRLERNELPYVIFRAKERILLNTELILEIKLMNLAKNKKTKKTNKPMQGGRKS
jgi:hypothetical protein